MTTYNLHTDAGHSTNGTTHESRESLLAAVRAAYGDCDFGITEGTIVDESGELIATFGA